MNALYCHRCGYVARCASVSPLRRARSRMVLAPVPADLRRPRRDSPPFGRADQVVDRAVGRPGLPGDGAPVDPLRLRLGQVGVRRRGHRLRQQVPGLAGEQPHLVADGARSSDWSVGRSLLVALVEDVVQPGGAGGERHPEHRAVGVAAGRLQRAGPVRRGRRAGPQVQAPAGCSRRRRGGSAAPRHARRGGRVGWRWPRPERTQASPWPLGPPTGRRRGPWSHLVDDEVHRLGRVADRHVPEGAEGVECRPAGAGVAQSVPAPGASRHPTGAGPSRRSRRPAAGSGWFDVPVAAACDV